MKEKIIIVDDNLQHILNKKNLPVGGASVQSYSWFKGFKSIYDVKVLSQFHNQSEENKDILNFKTKKSKFFGLFYKLNEINKVLKKEKPKALFVSVAGINAFIFGTLCKLNKVVYIQRISNDISFDSVIYKKKLGIIKYKLAVYGIKKADIVLCQNKTQYKNLKNFVKTSKIHIIHNPFNIENQVVKNIKRDYVAWLGLFQYQKNMTLLFSIAEKMNHINFKIAGEPIKKIDEKSKQAIHELQKLKNVEFVGLLNRKEVFKFLNGAICLLNTSRYEGFSNTFLEAFSTNTPVLTTKKIDPDNIILDNDLGFVAENDSDLVRLLSKINDDFDRLNFNSKSYLEKNHLPIALASKIDQLIKQTQNDK